MAHLVYHTEALVLQVADTGEANRMITLFTCDFGQITAHAQGVRWLKSKLRYSLQPFTRVSVTLVRGREMWKVINAQAVESNQELDKKAKTMIAELFAVLRRLLHGEERHSDLFAEVSAWLEFVSQLKEFWLGEVIVNLAILRVLALLGYVSLEQLAPDDKLLTDPWSAELVSRASQAIPQISRAIEFGFLHSQL